VFSSNVGVIQVFSREGFNSVGLENPKEFSKIPRFLGGFKVELGIFHIMSPKGFLQGTAG
jgi:hypothetical protein